MNGAKVMRRFAYALLFALLGATSVAAQDKTPVGVWLHANKRIRVEIARVRRHCRNQIKILRYSGGCRSIVCAHCLSASVPFPVFRILTRSGKPISGAERVRPHRVSRQA